MAFKREKVVRNAEKYVSKGKIEAAIKEYMKVLKEFPNEAGTLNRVGDLYARIDKDDDAIRLFTQIAEQYSTQGFLVKAIAIYKKILRLDPARLAVYERLGGLYYNQGLINEARGQFQVLADHYLKNSDAASAINIYQRMSEIEPENPSHHLKLAELYQQGQLWDQAMESYDAIARLMLEHDRVEEAFRVYQRALEVHSSDIDFIRTAVGRLQTAGGPGPASRLLAVATDLNPRAQSVADSLRPDTGQFEPLVADEIESGELEVVAVGDSTDQLEAVELQAVDEEPEYEISVDDSGALELDLEADEDLVSIDEVAAIEAPPVSAGEEIEDRPIPEHVARDGAIEGVAFEMESADDLPSADLAEAMETPGGEPLEYESSDELEIDLDLDFDLEIDVDEEPGEMEPEEASADPAGVSVPEPAPEEPQPQAPSINPDDLVAEAEVFAKYGLTTKAKERVASVLESHPDLISARRLDLVLRLEGGDGRDELVARARSFRELTVSAPDIWNEVNQRLATAGIRISSDEIEVVAAPEPPPEPKKERVSRLLEALEEPVVPRRRGPKLDIDAALAELTSGVSKKKRKRSASAAVDDLMAQAGLGGAAAGEELPSPPAAAQAPAEPASEMPTVPQESTEAVPMAPTPDLATGMAAAPIAEPVSPDLPPPTVEEVVPEVQAGELAGAPDEAPWSEDAVPSLDDDDLDLELEGFKLPEERPAEVPTLDDSAMNWLDEIPQQPAVQAETQLFEGEDDFFDLAAELEEELGQEEAANLVQDIVTQPEEPSLEDIVEGFKKGVAENLSAEDYGTHYNLGIAYREMGLIDEAIGEFQLASKDPAHLVECCSMLGVCFTEKGLYDLAVKWYKRGLEAPDLYEDTMLSLLYDMGDAYQSLGDEAAARKTFHELSGINIGFRDVMDRLEALGG